VRKPTLDPPKGSCPCGVVRRGGPPITWNRGVESCLTHQFRACVADVTDRGPRIGKALIPHTVNLELALEQAIPPAADIGFAGNSPVAVFLI